MHTQKINTNAALLTSLDITAYIAMSMLMGQSLVPPCTTSTIERWGSAGPRCTGRDGLLMMERACANVLHALWLTSFCLAFCLARACVHARSRLVRDCCYVACNVRVLCVVWICTGAKQTARDCCYCHPNEKYYVLCWVTTSTSPLSGI